MFQEILQGGGGSEGYSKSYIFSVSTSNTNKYKLSFEEIGFEPQVVLGAIAIPLSGLAYIGIGYQNFDNKTEKNIYGTNDRYISDVKTIYATKDDTSITLWQNGGSSNIATYFILLGN